MNEYNNSFNSGPITPYKASGNLNTAIGNPQINVNDPMNVNIQNMATNNIPVASPITNNITGEPQIKSTNTNINVPINNQIVQNVSNIQYSNNTGQPRVDDIQSNNIEQPRVEIQKPISNPTPVYTNQSINSGVSNNQNNVGPQKTYVTMDNKPKKKKLSLSLGPEFKIGLLIIVILLVFVLFLPMISEFFNGY